MRGGTEINLQKLETLQRGAAASVQVQKTRNCVPGNKVRGRSVHCERAPKRGPAGRALGASGRQE